MIRIRRVCQAASYAGQTRCIGTEQTVGRDSATAGRDWRMAWREPCSMNPPR